MPVIYDHAGREVVRTGTRPPRASVSRDVIASRWDAIATDITPQLVVSYLLSAERGSLAQQTRFFDRMVDRDSRLQAVSGTRRLAVSGAARWIQPREGAPDEARAQAAADVVAEVLAEVDLELAIDILLDAVLKGVQIEEIEWEPGGGVGQLVEVPSSALRWKDGRLEVQVSASMWVPLEPNKFIVHAPRLKPGYAERRGLLRGLSILWVAKHWAMKDWAAFTEVFGIPMRVGKYDDTDPNADDLRDLLVAALESLGSDAAAAIPKSMDIEFPKPVNVGTVQERTPMQSFVEYVNKEYAIAVLGQNLTTEGVSGSGTLAGGAHEQVRSDYRRADAKAVAKTIENDLFRPIVGYNLGWDYPVPQLVFDVGDSIDEERRAKTLVSLGGLGMTFSASQVRSEFSLDEPADEDDELRVSDTATTPTAALSSLLRRLGRGRLEQSSSDGPLSSAQIANQQLAQAGADAQRDAMRRLIGFARSLAEGGKVTTLEQLLTRVKLAETNLPAVLAAAGIDMDDYEDLCARELATAQLNGHVAVKAEAEV